MDRGAAFSVTYPIVEYGHTPAVFPTKLYEGLTQSIDASFINMLPGPASAVVSAILINLISM